MIKKLEEDDYFVCQKTQKKVSKSDPVCLSPKIYCKYRHMCVIYELYKEKLKKKNIKSD